MAGLLQEIINLRPKRSIGGIVAQATIEERHDDELVITEHPVEQGAAISDHAYKRPVEVVIRCGWSNSGYGALGALVSDIGSLLQGSAPSGSGGNNYVQSIYQQVLDLQGRRELIDVVTGKRRYSNMLIKSVVETTDARTENALELTITCRQVLIVETQATTLPPAARRANKKRTSSASNTGAKQAKPVPDPFAPR